jgi:D-alanine transaminase
VIGGEVITPMLATGILPGITRALVLGRCAALGIPARERTLSLAALRSASEMFLTNSVQEVVPVAALDGHPMHGREVASRLGAAYRQAVAEALAADR